MAAKNTMADKTKVVSSSDDDDSVQLPVSKRKTTSKSRTLGRAAASKKKRKVTKPVKPTKAKDPDPTYRPNLKRTNAKTRPKVKAPAPDEDDDDDDEENVIPLPKRLRVTAANTTPGVKSATTTTPQVAPPKTAPQSSNPAAKTQQTSSNKDHQPQTAKSTKSTAVKDKPAKCVSDEAAKLLTTIGPEFTTALMDSGAFTAEVLTPSCEDYTNILDYIVNSQAHGFGVKMISIIKITQPSHQIDTAQTLSNPVDDFKMMLFHGTKPTTVSEIMKSGFRCPESAGQMFGQGIYFADRVSKSSLYVTPLAFLTIGFYGYIFVCEVQLGKMYNAKNPNHSYKSPPSIIRKNGEVIPCDSVKCTGANIPNRERQRTIGDVIWPLGPTVQNSQFPSYTTQYNEFIVYDPNRVKVKYLAKVQITASPYFEYD